LIIFDWKNPDCNLDILPNTELLRRIEDTEYAVEQSLLGCLGKRSPTVTITPGIFYDDWFRPCLRFLTPDSLRHVCESDGLIGFPILFPWIKAANNMGTATSQSDLRMELKSLRMELKSLPPYLDAQQNQFDLAIPLVVENWGDKKRVSLRGHRFVSELC
jgi:hypothetical protein